MNIYLFGKSNMNLRKLKERKKRLFYNCQSASHTSSKHKNVPKFIEPKKIETTDKVYSLSHDKRTV